MRYVLAFLATLGSLVALDRATCPTKPVPLPPDPLAAYRGYQPDLGASIPDAPRVARPTFTRSVTTRETWSRRNGWTTTRTETRRD